MPISSWGIRVITEPAAVKTELLKAIKLAGGHRSEAAVALSLPHRTFYNLLEKVGIARDGGQPKPAKKAGKKAKKKAKARSRKKV